MHYPDLKRRLDGKETVYLDGGIGTEILRRGYTWASHQLESEPQLNLEIHRDYIAAGADVITTNTFQLSRRSFRNHFANEQHMLSTGAPGLVDRVAALVSDAVTLAAEAREMAGRKDVAIAASITTLEWCFRPDRTPDPEQMHAEYLEELSDYKSAGADMLLFETFNSTAEAKVALQAAGEIGLPAWVALVPYGDGKLLGGESMNQVVEALASNPPDVLLLNCAPPEHITAGLENLAPLWDGPLGVYAHVGKFNPPEWQFTDEFPPEAYLAVCRRWHELGATVIGGCCGTTPDHIAALTAAALS
ncbi:MAG: homocysteine S-methyltransferase family protein [Candidatus Marinimicrobia bacterium]|nr:homocysteine S-methyltransferase family protein [Candidatus Neomarinimicrobiota bacterium]